MDNKILKIYTLMQDISWYFGNQAFDNDCCENLSLVEYMVLKTVCEFEDITVQQLGIKLNITKSGISKIIDRLEDKKYVLRKKSAEDGRVCCIHATNIGLNIFKKISIEYSNYVMNAVKDLDEKSISELKQNLEILYKAIQQKGYIK